VFEDFPAMVAEAPNVTFAGPYGPGELPQLYARCHFAWAVDYFEEGLNSEWLLPNKLYEASSFGAVPIALGSVETGRWLARHEAGLLLDEGDPSEQLRRLIGSLDDAAYRQLRAAIEAIPGPDLIAHARLRGAPAGGVRR
jgi:glycosyltransferase involved in cell wall biosynthesis